MSTDKYTVRQNTCGCHPQTCCCDDWAIFTETGEKFLTLDSKLLADVMAENYNLRSRETELESQVEALKQAARYETDVAAQAIADFNAMKLEVEALRKDAERLDWVIDNASSAGGGNGFTLKVFVPVDCECVRTAIDAAIKGEQAE